MLALFSGRLSPCDCGVIICSFRPRRSSWLVSPKETHKHLLPNSWNKSPREESHWLKAWVSSEVPAVTAKCPDQWASFCGWSQSLSWLLPSCTSGKGDPAGAVVSRVWTDRASARKTKSKDLYILPPSFSRKTSLTWMLHRNKSYTVDFRPRENLNTG